MYSAISYRRNNIKHHDFKRKKSWKFYDTREIFKFCNEIFLNKKIVETKLVFLAI